MSVDCSVLDDLINDINDDAVGSVPYEAPAPQVSRGSGGTDGEEGHRHGAANRRSNSSRSAANMQQMREAKALKRPAAAKSTTAKKSKRTETTSQFANSTVNEVVPTVPPSIVNVFKAGTMKMQRRQCR